MFLLSNTCFRICPPTDIHYRDISWTVAVAMVTVTPNLTL